MFNDLDETIKAILDDPAAPTELRAADVSFQTPERAYAPAAATVNLFLHEVRENVALRDPMPITTTSDGRYVRRLPPGRVACSYLVTTWSKKTGAAKTAEEHRLLGQALFWLRRFPTIPGAYLRGTLADPLYPPPTAVAQADGETRSGEFWSALGISPRPSFTLQVTVELDLDVAATGPLVTTYVTQFVVGEGEGEVRVQIGGQVIDAAGKGVADALVDLDDGGQQTRTDDAGRYTFAGVTTGTRTVRVTAVGFAPKTATITVPGPPGAYAIRLTPLP